jgi:hypothetical protein
MLNGLSPAGKRGGAERGRLNRLRNELVEGVSENRFVSGHD